MDNITVVATSPLMVSDEVVNRDGGQIILTAGETANGGDDLMILAKVTVIAEQFLPRRIVQHQGGVHFRVDTIGVTVKQDSLPRLQVNAKEVATIAIHSPIDCAINGHFHRLIP